MFTFTVFLVAAVWRFVDGSSHKPFAWNVVGIAVAIIAAIPIAATGHFISALVVAGIASLNILGGYTKWDSLAWMSWRFSSIGVATVGVVFLFVPEASLAGGIQYLALTAALGPIYAYRDTWARKLPRNSWLDGGEAYCRFFSGAFILGGISILV